MDTMPDLVQDPVTPEAEAAELAKEGFVRESRRDQRTRDELLAGMSSLRELVQASNDIFFHTVGAVQQT